MTPTPPPRTHRHGRHTQRQTVAAVEAVAPMLGVLEQLYALAADWSPGYSSGQADVKVAGGGGDGSPAPPGTWQPRPVDDLDRVCAALRVACDELGRIGVDLLHRSSDTGRSRGPGSGNCQCCDEWVSGVQPDVLRQGLCDACRKRVQRMAVTHPQFDRQDRIIRVRMAIMDEREGVPS